MTAYCIVQANNIDKQGLMEYGKHAAAALAKHGGSVLGKSTNPAVLDGAKEADDLIVILSFPTEEDALAWRQDEVLSHVHDLRNASGDWIIQLLSAG